MKNNTMNLIALSFVTLLICLPSLAQTHGDAQNSQAVSRPIADKPQHKDISQFIGFRLDQGLRNPFKQMKIDLENHQNGNSPFPITRINQLINLLKTKEQLFCEWRSDLDKTQPLQSSMNLAEDEFGKKILQQVAAHPTHKASLEIKLKDAIKHRNKAAFLDLVYFFPYSESSLEALYHLLMWSLDHGHYQEAHFYTELIDKRFPHKKSKFSPQLEMRQLYLSSLMGNLEKKEDSIKTSLNQYLKENSKKGISLAGKKHHSYEEVLESITDMTQSIKQPEDNLPYPQGLIAQLEEEIYKNPPSQKTSEYFQILRLFPGHFSEEVDKNLCDIASLINHEDQWDLLTTNPQKFEDYISLSVYKLGKDALPLVKKVLNDKNSHIHFTVAHALPTLTKKLDKKNALNLVKKALNNEDPFVLYATTQALPALTQKLDKKDALPLVKKALNHKNSIVRSAVAQALPSLVQTLNKEDTLNLVKKALSDKHSHVREAAVTGLPTLAQTLGKEDTLSLVKKALNDKDSDVRYPATQALPALAQTLGKEDTLNLVKKALSDEDSYVVKAGAKALKIIESK